MDGRDNGHGCWLSEETHKVVMVKNLTVVLGFGIVRVLSTIRLGPVQALHVNSGSLWFFPNCEIIRLEISLFLCI